MEAENMRDPRELALENMRDAKEQALKDRPKTYRITVEAIGPEVDLMNNGAPYIIETDGFFIIGISKNDDGMGIELAAHHVSPEGIAKGLINCGHWDDIMKAVRFEQIKRIFAAPDA